MRQDLCHLVSVSMRGRSPRFSQETTDKSSRIVIYGNNNFENEPRALPGKMAAASLNLYTFNTLYSYWYKNVYELGPLIDIKKSVLTFEGSLVPTSR